MWLPGVWMGSTSFNRGAAVGRNRTTLLAILLLLLLLLRLLLLRLTSDKPAGHDRGVGAGVGAGAGKEFAYDVSPLPAVHSVS